jgi:phosphoribosyl 1,2-cyclic phosphodiesterase
MTLKLCVLASGSAANCIYVASEQTSILIDAGLSGAETARRLSGIGVDPDAIHAICVTHEHNDHCSALSALHRRHHAALYANSGTIEAIERDDKRRGLPWQVFTTGSPFHIRDLCVAPFSVPHDSYDPVGFVVSAGSAQLGIVTDMGTATALIRERLKPCCAIVVECNHDPALLRNSKRPWALKQRIAGRQGHLANDQTGELIASIAGPRLRTVLLAHLSTECNRPELAMRAVQDVLRQSGHAHIAVRLTYPDRVSDVVSVE